MFPSREVRIIVPYGRDGASDRLGRAVGACLAQLWGVAVEYENLPGAGTATGMRRAADAPADGHTLMLGTSTTHALAPALRRDLGLEPARAFAPLCMIGWSPNLLLVRRGLAASVQEVVALARSRPGVLRYASAGAGQTIHLCAELFARLAGVSLFHVPFERGSMDGLKALAAGRVDLMFDNVLAALPMLRERQVDALGVASSMPCTTLPELPTLAESGVPGYSADIWLGLFAPAATPSAVQETLARDIATVLGQTDLVAELRALGLMLDVQSGEDFAAEIALNARDWRSIIALSGPHPV
ncbi:MAG: Bug family tripartite tricarboxylate transporter substrate binding protein [Burkholderiales bacterium]